MNKDRYVRGAHTVTELKYHFVWKTKYSYGVLKGEMALRARDIIREICTENGMQIVKGHVGTNHIHLMVSAPAHLSVAKIAQYLKGKSSYKLQREFPALRKQYWGQHLWGRGYFCATVGAVTEQQIKDYIANQTEDPGTFKVWDEAGLSSEATAKLESDSPSE